MPTAVTALVEQTIRAFCLSFLESPYLCYTEHGLHAYFYRMLYDALPAKDRYLTWNHQKLCAVQKEYPTAGMLGKPRRQHWDIAVIQNPPQSVENKWPSYDYLRLAAVVEFGMNESEEHLRDDIERLCHPEANMEKRYIVHLYRLSPAGAPLSGRDWSCLSGQICSKERMAAVLQNRPIYGYYAIWDPSKKIETGLWHVDGAGLSQLSEETCVRETVYDPACGTGGIPLDAENVPGTDQNRLR